MLFQPLFHHAATQGDEIAVIDDHGQYTFGQLAAMAAGMGMYLRLRTARPHVGLLLPTGAGYLVSFYGTLLAGKSIVPINFLLSQREIEHIIQDSGIDTVLTVAPLAGRLEGMGLNVIDLATLPRPTAPAAPPALPSPKPDDLAVLMYTSGTSGLPKGVMLSYGNLQSDVDACIVHAGLQRRHKFLGVIPLFHSFGMTATMLAPIQLGAHITYLGRFSPVAMMNALRDQQTSIIFGVPSMFGAVLHLKNASADDFKHIYAIITGGEPLPGLLSRRFTERFGVPLLEGYGLTETSPVVALNTPQAHRPGSVGRTVPGVEVKITDDNDTPLPPGEMGEVWLRGPMIMKGYFNRPEESAAALHPDGFFKTGDLGKIDADGFLHITGRKKDLIIVAGEKVVPREIEEVLLRHPMVAEAAVVGRKDPTRGEAVVAFVIPREEQSIRPEELREICRAHGLPPWKCPRDIHLRKELPRSPTGKVLKRALVDELSAQE